MQVLLLDTGMDVAHGLLERGAIKGMSKSLLNEAYLRRIAKLGAHNEDEEEAEDRYKDT